MSAFVTVMRYLRSRSKRTYLELSLCLLAVLIVARLSYVSMEAVYSPTLPETLRR